jgi:hypothetical protein
MTDSRLDRFLEVEHIIADLGTAAGRPPAAASTTATSGALDGFIARRTEEGGAAPVS